MREIVLDTETTGLDPASGHRLVELGCVELVNHIPTGQTFHSYINPERDMPAEAFAVHGLTAEFLLDFPIFRGVAQAFLDFVQDSPLVIHNAAFDIAFLNAELRAVGLEPIAGARAVDTLPLALRRFPGTSNSLDALCRRFSVDLSARTLHGALLDCHLLAEVYLHLRGGRQVELGLTLAGRAAMAALAQRPRQARPARPHAPSPAELAAHAAFVGRLDNPIWTS